MISIAGTVYMAEDVEACKLALGITHRIERLALVLGLGLGLGALILAPIHLNVNLYVLT